MRREKGRGIKEISNLLARATSRSHFHPAGERDGTWFLVLTSPIHEVCGWCVKEKEDGNWGELLF